LVSRAALGLGGIASDVDRDDRDADVDGLALLDEEGGDRAVPRAGQLHDGLRGLDVHDDLVDFDRVARLDVPRHDVGLGEAFPDVGELELSRHSPFLPAQNPNVRSTPSRILSRSGR
jgi:hypothetical protein